RKGKDMSDALGIDARWSDLLSPLDGKQRRAITQALAGGMHEGWDPDRADVLALIDQVRGAVDIEEYKRRALERAQQRANG
ncbi:antitoxin VbhA family protein, partial [Brachybacterium tyrofermentans]|uniref:antitoxin VbhA family protein n=2 Tax=Brachybacterium tyrofermentans TaxID=47848 RepID=UPI003FD2987A